MSNSFHPFFKKKSFPGFVGLFFSTWIFITAPMHLLCIEN